MSDRYSCPSIDSLWTLEAQYGRWLQVWVAQLAACGAPHQAPPLRASARSWFVEQAADYEARMGHDVAAACEVFRDWLPVTATEAKRWLHYGLCSSDVVDAGWLLAFRSAVTEFGSLTKKVDDELGSLADDRAPEETLYRTHGQAAQVTHGGHRWAGYRTEFEQAWDRVRSTRPQRWGLQGPTGTGSAFGVLKEHQIAKALGLGLRDGYSGQQACDRTEWVQWAHAVAALATLAQRVATQIRLLAYEEVGEVTEGRDEGYRASSSMPHKSAGGRSNPTHSERICGLAAVIRGLANAYGEAAASVWDSHSLEHSSAERILIPQITGLTGYVLTELADVLRTLKLDTNQIALNAFRSGLSGEDSYARRNRLIREGVTADTWTASRDQADLADRAPEPSE